MAHVYATHLVWSDDFTSYANDAAWEAAYPYDPPGNMSFSGVSGDTNWGATNGPDGQPGILGDILSGTGDFEKFPLSPQGRTFRYKARHHFKTNSTGVVTLDWAPSGSRASDLMQPVIVTKASGNLALTARTTAAYANVGSPFYRYVATSALTLPGTYNFQVDWRLSSMTETSPGVFAPSTDGWVDVWIDGSIVMTFDGALWGGRSDINPNPYFNLISIYANDKVTNVELYDLVSTSSTTRNLVTGQGHTFTGQDNVLAGKTATVVGNRNALFNLKTATPHTVTADNTFAVYADTIILNGTTTIGGGSPVTDINAALDSLGT